MNKKIDTAVLENLSIWLGVDRPIVKEKLDEIGSAGSLNGLLDLDVITPAEAFMRRLFHKVLLYSSEPNRYRITDTLKRFRQLLRKELIEISECRFVHAYVELQKKLNIKPIDWNGHKGVVCLSHDLDSKACYDFSPTTFELEKKFGCKATYNFLTNWGYKPEKAFLKELDSAGYEVGLHGLTHDIALGARPKSRIKNELGRAIGELDFPVKGFRAPAFSITKTLLEVLVELGIKYDGSMKTLSCYGQGVETPYPYKYPNIDIWEVPLTIQDDRVFRDLHLSGEEGVGVVKELTQRIINVGGVVVINTHPRLLGQNMHFYRDLLEWLSGMDDIWVATMWEVVQFMEERKNAIQK